MQNLIVETLDRGNFCFDMDVQYTQPYALVVVVIWIP
jgi:hypothetical protein